MPVVCNQPKLIICKTESEFIDSLFSETGTADGFISCRNKNGIHFVLAGGNEYCLNQNRVICAVSKGKNGKRWYSFAENRIRDDYARIIEALNAVTERGAN